MSKKKVIKKKSIFKTFCISPTDRLITQFLQYRYVYLCYTIIMNAIFFVMSHTHNFVPFTYQAIHTFGVFYFLSSGSHDSFCYFIVEFLRFLKRHQRYDAVYFYVSLLLKHFSFLTLVGRYLPDENNNNLNFYSNNHDLDRKYKCRYIHIFILLQILHRHRQANNKNQNSYYNHKVCIFIFTLIHTNNK